MSKYFFEAAFEVVSDLVCIIAENRSILKANKAVCERTGLSDGALRGKKCYSVFFNKSEPCDDCPFEECKTTLKTVTSEVVDDFILTLSPVFNSHPEPIGFVHILKDVSELNNKKKELKKLNSQCRIGSILVGEGSITPEQLEMALEIKDISIGKILIDLGIIDEDSLQEALDIQKQSNG